MKRPPDSFLRPIAALTLGLSCAACGPSNLARTAVPARGPAMRVGDLEDRFLLTGELRAVRSSGLTTPRTPTWTVTIEWMEEEGTRVDAGTPVVQFDSTSVLSTLEDKRLAVTEAEQELLRQRVDLSRTRYQKTQELERTKVESERTRLEASIPQSIRPEREYQEAQLALHKAEAEREKARRDLEAFEAAAESQLEEQRIRVAKARRDLERAEASLDELTLRAPAAGVLLHGSHPWEGRKWEVGDTTWPGTTVAEVPDLSEMEVVAWLSDVDDGQVLPGMPSRCVLDTYPERSYAGRVTGVTEVAQEPDQGSSRRFFRVLVALDDVDDAIMRPGMSVKVEVVRNRWRDVSIVPREGLISDGKGRMVLEGDPEREITLLGCNAIECAVDDGESTTASLRAGP